MKWHRRSRSPEQAVQDRRRVQAAWDETRSRRGEVEREAGRLRAYREANHFAEAIAATMRRQP